MPPVRLTGSVAKDRTPPSKKGKGPLTSPDAPAKKRGGRALNATLAAASDAPVAPPPPAPTATPYVAAEQAATSLAAASSSYAASDPWVPQALVVALAPAVTAVSEEQLQAWFSDLGPLLPMPTARSEYEARLAELIRLHEIHGVEPDREWLESVAMGNAEIAGNLLAVVCVYLTQLDPTFTLP